MPAKFDLGKMVMTRGARSSVPVMDMLGAMGRHLRGDWGDVDAEDRATNDRALEGGGRLLSAYHTKSRVKFWIITEADRSATTVLLPEEY